MQHEDPERRRKKKRKKRVGNVAAKALKSCIDEKEPER